MPVSDNMLVLDRWNGRATEMLVGAGADLWYRRLIIGRFEDFDVWMQVEFRDDDTLRYDLFERVPGREIEIWGEHGGFALGGGKYIVPASDEPVRDLLFEYTESLLSHHPEAHRDLTDWLNA